MLQLILIAVVAVPVIGIIAAACDAKDEARFYEDFGIR